MSDNSTSSSKFQAEEVESERKLGSLAGLQCATDPFPRGQGLTDGQLEQKFVTGHQKIAVTG